MGEIGFVGLLGWGAVEAVSPRGYRRRGHMGELFSGETGFLRAHGSSLTSAPQREVSKDPRRVNPLKQVTFRFHRK